MSNPTVLTDASLVAQIFTAYTIQRDAILERFSLPSPAPSLPRNDDSGAARRVGGHGMHCGPDGGGDLPASMRRPGRAQARAGPAASDQKLPFDKISPDLSYTVTNPFSDS